MRKTNRENNKTLIYLLVPTLLLFSIFIQCTKENEAPPLPSIELLFSQDSNLYFGYFFDSRPLVILNSGNETAEWLISSESDLITFSENSGEINPGDSVEIMVNLHRENVTGYDFTADIILENKLATGERILTVIAKNYNAINFLEKGTVMGARYDRVHDKLILITKKPHELRKINTTNHTTEFISLVLPPQALSVRSDGKFAVVAHNGWVSHINLELMTVENVFPVPADINDIIIAPNNWVYFFPKPAQNILSLNLATGDIIEITGMSGRQMTRANLHPSGNYFYRIIPISSPTRLEKFETLNGPAVFLYNKPGYSSNSFGSYFWISDNGNRIFSNNRNVFISSSQQEEDMVIFDRLEGSAMIIAFDYHTAANRIYTVQKTHNSFGGVPDKRIRKYDATDLSFLGTVEIPDFLVDIGGGNGEYYDAQGQFGFFNAAGNKYFVLINPHPNSETYDQWAWVCFEVE